MILFRLFVKGGGLMMRISSRQFFSRADRLRCFADEHAIHDDSTARRNIIRHELMFRGNVGPQSESPARKINLFALLKVIERNEHIVFRI